MVEEQTEGWRGKVEKLERTRKVYLMLAAGDPGHCDLKLLPHLSSRASSNI